jgi:hypothetical protein
MKTYRHNLTGEEVEAESKHDLKQKLGVSTKKIIYYWYSVKRPKRRDAGCNGNPPLFK